MGINEIKIVDDKLILLWEISGCLGIGRILYPITTNNTNKEFSILDPDTNLLTFGQSI